MKVFISQPMRNRTQEDIKEEIEKLKKKQIEVLGYGADDLYVREEIAELEDKLKKLKEEGE